MMKKLSAYKKILILVTILSVLTLICITIDVIAETSPRELFNLDFENKSDEISAYGTLISGLLSFLSILFVIFGLFEQRQQILKEKRDKKIEYKNGLLDKLTVLSSFLKSLLNSINKQGEIMREYYELEKNQPSKMNRMYFISSKNFARVINMNFEEIYDAIRQNFKSEQHWEKIFLNTYSLIDFYAEGIEDLKEKYKSQIQFKVDEQRKINHEILRMMNLGSTLVDDYKQSYPKNYMEYPWVRLQNEFTEEYYAYLKLCERDNEATDLRIISDTLLLPFIQAAMKLRAEIGFDTMGSRGIIALASDIRKKITEIEVHCKDYAEDIETQYNIYFSPDCESIKLLQEIKSKLDCIVAVD